MANKPKAIYEPGELDRVRKKLGPLDEKEAKRMAEVLGGEVGIEKSKKEEKPPARPSRYRRDVNLTLPRQAGPGTSPQTKSPSASPIQRKRPSKKEPVARLDPADDPSIPVRPSWGERIKMDRYAAQPSFEIKNSTQLISSIFSFFGTQSDYVNPDFVSRRLNEYYSTLQTLVVHTRSLLPRNNVSRADKVERISPFAYSVINCIRSWPLEIFSNNLAKIQANPRDVLVTDCYDILHAVYRPLYLLERLDLQRHIQEAYKVVYKVLLSEDSEEAKRRYNPLIRSALAALAYTREHIRYLLYPLLLKVISPTWLSYKDLFTQRRNRFLSFIQANPADQIPIPEKIIIFNKEDAPPEKKEDVLINIAQTYDPALLPPAVKKGLNTLDQLFPKAGLKKAWTFPDLYAYFSDIFDLPKGFDLIAPEDPMHLVIILIHILEEFFYGLRYVAFNTVPDADNELVHVAQDIDKIINTWHDFIERLLVKEYYQRLNEYCRILDNTSESRTSRYALTTLSEAMWIKRLFFMPYFRFESMLTRPHFRHSDLPKLHKSIRELKRILGHVAICIEKGMKAGGAKTDASCSSIENPWEPWNFQVPNPISIRISALLPEKKPSRRTNAALVYYTLSVVSVLDYIVNDTKSWGYLDRNYYPYRSVDNRGNKAIYGMSEEIDTMALFKESLKKPKAEKDS